MQPLQNFSLRLFAILLVFSIGCDISTHQKAIIVKGNIQGLPDGMMYLKDIRLNNIDSTPTSNGKFIFEFPITRFPEPVYAQMSHVAKADGQKRLFSFPTKRKQTSIGLLMLEKGVAEINGLLSESDFQNLKLATVKGEISFGPQTQVLYGENPDFSKSPTTSAIRNRIKAQPYSYHLLYELNERMRRCTDEQLLSILSCFDEEVRKGRTAVDLKNYITSRGNKRLDLTTTLPDSSNFQTGILHKNAKINMVILWASWCGPCRREIPQLKNIYAQFGKNAYFNMVSISMDQDTGKWVHALIDERMPWKQLVMTPEVESYSRELFGYNKRVPLTVFVDQDGKIIKKYEGYNEKSEAEFASLISKYVSTDAQGLVAFAWKD